MDTKEKESNNSLKDLIIEALGTVYDPEIPVSIWELGLVYNIDIDEKFNVLIDINEDEDYDQEGHYAPLDELNYDGQKGQTYIVFADVKDFYA